MDETKNVTYLLGAGASYNALPIVVNWNARLEQFHGFIKIEVPKFKALGIESDKVLGEIDEILKAAKKHATIDTYAKKLFLKNLSDSKQRLLSLKHFLGCFFSFEQTWLTNWDPLISEKGNETISRLSDQFEGQKKQVDERYDVFFATLLKEPRLELDERVNIISWNYDLQLELAYSDFNEKSNPHKKLKITPNAFGLEQETRVVKLNGSAGMFFNPEFYLAGDEGGFIPCLKNDELMQQEEFKIPSLECLFIFQ